MPHKKQSSWISHVKKTYHAKKKSNPNY
eukprot:SAG11_NODE_40689_length_199_cov_171.960000_1_plen_27_part_10